MAPGRPMRVAILIDSLSQGGAERVAIEAAGALDRNRYLPHLIVTRQSGVLAALASERGIDLTVLDRRRGFAPKKLARALSIVRRSDVVHAHLWGSGMWGALLARCARRPFIAHAHRFDADRSRGWLPGYRYWIAPTADRVVCVSDEIAAAFQAAGVPAAKLVVVPNGVVLGSALPRTLARTELGLPSAARVVGMVARLREEKRHDLALRCISLVRQRGHDVVLCIVGDGPEEQRLRLLADELGLAGAVSWAGARESAGRLIAAFDVALITSSVEGMPLAALEALVEGVPIVSTPAGAMPDLLANGGGTLVEGWDVSELADAVVATLEDPGVEALDRSAQWARGAFGIDHVARELERIYDSAIAASP